MKDEIMKIKYPVGTKFTPRGGKETRPEETVEDILRTYNAKDELVKVRYLCTHEFCGQRVRSEYPQTSLDLSNLLIVGVNALQGETP